jgi:hypothetical protein
VSKLDFKGLGRERSRVIPTSGHLWTRCEDVKAVAKDAVNAGIRLPWLPFMLSGASGVHTGSSPLSML